ncbi:MAG: GntR family transcriptional regulator [Gemmobacter sp.]
MPAMTWQAVQDEALRRIRSREWTPGARIPDEEALARELGCARATVNRALRELAAAGYLERRRKGGTRLSETPVRKATFEIPIIRQDIEARGMRASYRLLSARETVLPPAVRAALKRPADTRFLHVLALHTADGAPFCLEDRWINPAVEGVGTADFATLSANEWLVRNTAFSGGDVAFGAVAADATVAGHLGCAPGTALLTLDRTTWAGPTPITAARLTYAEGHRVETRL